MHPVSYQALPSVNLKVSRYSLLALVFEWYLFFKTAVYKNYYRLALFIFVFIYQFTGSYITNIVEYVIWILAFSNAFPQFNINAKKQ